MKLWLTFCLTICCVSCDKIMPEEKKPEEEELVTPEQKEAIDKFGKRLPES